MVTALQVLKKHDSVRDQEILIFSNKFFPE